MHSGASEAVPVIDSINSALEWTCEGTVELGVVEAET
jgi:hypothetical protein